MQFLMMCCINENQWARAPEAERKRIMDEYGKFVDGLKRGGHYVAGAKLDPSSRAVTVRQKNGKPVPIDGPFAETREQLGGYHVVECTDREQAVSLAMRIPTLAVGGTVEVRAIVPVAYE